MSSKKEEGPWESSGIIQCRHKKYITHKQTKKATIVHVYIPVTTFLGNGKKEKNHEPLQTGKAPEWMHFFSNFNHNHNTQGRLHMHGYNFLRVHANLPTQIRGEIISFASVS